MRNPNPIINWAKELKEADTKEKEESIIYQIRCAVDEYEEDLVASNDENEPQVQHYSRSVRLGVRGRK